MPGKFKVASFKTATSLRAQPVQTASALWRLAARSFWVFMVAVSSTLKRVIVSCPCPFHGSSSPGGYGERAQSTVLRLCNPKPRSERLYNLKGTNSFETGPRTESTARPTRPDLREFRHPNCIRVALSTLILGCRQKTGTCSYFNQLKVSQLNTCCEQFEVFFLRKHSVTGWIA